MAKKASSKKAAAKPKATAKKATTKKPAQKAKKTTAKPESKLPSERRPPNNPDMPEDMIEDINEDLNRIKAKLEAYAVHLRALDRRRLGGVGIRKQGFIELAFQLAVKNPNFLPHYLTLEKFRKDGEYFLSFRSLTVLTDQLHELMHNVTSLSSNVWYTDALEYYSSVEDASKRGVDPAETLYKTMEPFFGRPGRKGEDGKPALTKKKLERDEKAIASGKKNGVVAILNEKPKLTGGIHKVIDEEWKDSEQFKETEDGEIKE
jgi:hypothetical protein